MSRNINCTNEQNEQYGISTSLIPNNKFKLFFKIIVHCNGAELMFTTKMAESLPCLQFDNLFLLTKPHFLATRSNTNDISDNAKF